MNNETDSSQPPKLLDQVRTAIRLRRMSYRTEQTYCDWIKRFIKDRVTMLPLSLKEPLCEHLKTVKQAHEIDLLEGFGNVELPFALSRKYPQADKEWKWQYVFPAPKRSIDPRTKIERRHHLDPSVL